MITCRGAVTAAATIYLIGFGTMGVPVVNYMAGLILCGTGEALAQDVRAFSLKPEQHEVFGRATEKGNGYLIMQTRTKANGGLSDITTLRVDDAAAQKVGSVVGFLTEDAGWCANCLRVVGTFNADHTMTAITVHHALPGGERDWPKDR